MADQVQTFIDRWNRAGAAERANCQMFLAELCDLLDVPRPDPATPDTSLNTYVFERAVVFRYGDGTSSNGRIDLYKRGSFVLEAKQGAENPASGQEAPLSTVVRDQNRRMGRGIGSRGTPAWDEAMLRARGQAEQYVRALPPEDGRPPFIIVADVGHSLELYSEFSCSGGAYVPFPAPGSHRIHLEDLKLEEIRDRLRAVWTDPASLDPSRRSAQVTREIADRLAKLALALEKGGHDPHETAGFLMRCLFTMFAEDVGLLPKSSFSSLLDSLTDNPGHFVPMTEELWTRMNAGGFSTSLRSDVLRFNGGLFEKATALPLTRDQLLLLVEAAKCDWRDVEPAIFGTLLERALDPTERHKLGAHYTPREYVERLVMPTIINPIRAEWEAVRAAVMVFLGEGAANKAIAAVQSFHNRLRTVRVLDPACGSGNFLYVTLEHLKRIEGEVFDTFDSLGGRQYVMEMQLGAVDPHQLLGLEVNPRAAAIAEIVLWIGTLQWHFRNRGNTPLAEPVIRSFHNIECRDALIEWDAIEPVCDESGAPVTRWDGHSTMHHPVTGKEVPDESQRVPVVKYINPRAATWPAADYVVGNPPFIGSKRMRAVLGDGYVDAIQSAFHEVPQSADFVMRWWHRAADLVGRGSVRRAGLITTNTLGQTYVRRVVEQHLSGAHPVSIIYAVPDHPWVDSTDGAAVRISMTVLEQGRAAGVIEQVVDEHSRGSGHDDRVIQTVKKYGAIHADLSVGIDVTAARALVANSGLCSVGMKTIGAAFQVESPTATALGLGRISDLEHHIRPYMNGREFASTRTDKYVIDLFGLSETEVLARFPDVYQYLALNAQPERALNRNRQFRDQWWIIGHPRPQYRAAVAELNRYICTIETAKHRFFGFVDSLVFPDSTLVTVASGDAYVLGILSSRAHTSWALAQGGTLEDRPRYNKTRCFETFPFPNADSNGVAAIRAVAERLDSHRKARQALHPHLTMTGLYNVLQLLAEDAPLNENECKIHEDGLVTVLREIHDELDRLVAAAYGWPADISDDDILARLVDLNAERAQEEAAGRILWVRPEFQAASRDAEQQSLDVLKPTSEKKSADRPAVTLAWPAELPAQFRAVRAALVSAGTPVTADEVARRFTRVRAVKVTSILDTLVAIGQARLTPGGCYAGI